MGRKKIEIRPLTEDRNRNVTFLKRKAGLMKKAWELSVLCHADISMIIFSQQGKLFEFSSSNLEASLQRFHEYTGPVERKRGSDYSLNQGGNTSSDEDNILPEASGSGLGGGGGKEERHRKPALSVHSNLRGKEEWKNGTKSVVPVQSGKGKRPRTQSIAGPGPSARISSPNGPDELISSAGSYVPQSIHSERFPGGGGGGPTVYDAESSTTAQMRSGFDELSANGYEGRKRQRSMDHPHQYLHRPGYSTEPGGYASTPPPPQQPPMHSLYTSSMRSNGSQDPNIPPSGGHYPPPMIPRENNGGGGGGGGSYVPGPPPPNMGPYDARWMDGGMAASVQAKYHTEQSHLLALRQQAAQNQEFQRRLETGRPMGMTYVQPGHPMQDEEHPPMDDFLNQLMHEPPHHGGPGDPRAAGGPGEAGGAPWHPTPQDGGGVEAHKIGQPTAAEYLAMMRTGQQPPDIMPPSRTPSAQNSSRHA